MRQVWLSLILMALATSASAADLTVSVRDESGEPVSDAVVTFHPAKPVSVAGHRFGWPYRMAQQNIRFDPFVLVVPVGATVAFPNLDKVRHHVYSFSKPQPFELKLYGKDESRTISFAKPGTISVGCNIHDAMLAFIEVVDTPFAAKTTASGTVVLAGVSAGAGTLKVWHPFAFAGVLDKSVPLTLSAASVSQTVVLPVRRPSGHSH